MPPTLRIVNPKPVFDAKAFFCSVGVRTTISTYRPADVIFSQGDPSDSVMYVTEGVVKLSVLSGGGKEAVVAMLESGDFLGESALTGRPVRQQVATAMTATTVLTVPKQQMLRLLHERHDLLDRFMMQMLARNIRVEQDLVDQLLNTIEKRLARTLLLLAHDGTRGSAHRMLPGLSQQTLADMIGSTRSRVNFFMNKFKKRGFIEYSGGLKINNSLLTVISHDDRRVAKVSPSASAAEQ